jgi:hypothetical protein
MTTAALAGGGAAAVDAHDLLAGRPEGAAGVERELGFLLGEQVRGFC